MFDSVCKTHLQLFLLISFYIVVHDMLAFTVYTQYTLVLMNLFLVKKKKEINNATQWKSGKMALASLLLSSVY